MAPGRKRPEPGDWILPTGGIGDIDDSLHGSEGDHGRSLRLQINAYADFSGRGGERLSYPKPDLVAPGVNITAPVPGGGYANVTGTSFATPFVTGSAALMMEWGIVRRNDPFLWGEKVKAYLRRGAQPLPGFEKYPNESVGWGALCTAQSLFHM